jgi:hypothetical protein
MGRLGGARGRGEARGGGVALGGASGGSALVCSSLCRAGGRGAVSWASVWES